jgi:hypothetical protein
VVAILGTDPPLATLHDIYYKYTMPEIYDLLEYCEVQSFMIDMRNKQQEK